MTHIPQISDRSKELIGERDGQIGPRLHQAGKSLAARRQQAVEVASLHAEEQAAKEAREAIPEINGVSSMCVRRACTSTAHASMCTRWLCPPY